MTIRISGKDKMNGKYSVECDDCYKVKDQLKQAGYIWNPNIRSWMVNTDSTAEAMDKVTQLFEMGIADRATFEDLWTWAWTSDNDVRDLMDEAWQTPDCKGAAHHLRRERRIDMIFEEYGLLEWLDIDAYWRDGWSIYDKAVGDDGEAYDIVINLDKTELRYTTV